jgi:hypothetical protein
MRRSYALRRVAGKLSAAYIERGDPQVADVEKNAN